MKAKLKDWLRRKKNVFKPGFFSVAPVIPEVIEPRPIIRAILAGPKEMSVLWKVVLAPEFSNKVYRRPNEPLP